MKRAPAVYVVWGGVEETYAQGCGLITRAVRYHPGQVLFIFNPATSEHRVTRVTEAISGPLSHMTSSELEPVGYRSRGAVLDLLERDHGESIDLDAWVTILHWKK